MSGQIPFWHTKTRKPFKGQPPPRLLFYDTIGPEEIVVPFP